jgi:Delta3-Delta2-enoyl-CoA isomerase
MSLTRALAASLKFNRLFHVSSFNLVTKEFEEAKANLGTLKEDPGNDVKLKLYGLFKQATIGPCNTPKPGMMDFVGKAKWTAWQQLGSMTKEAAENEYIQVVKSLIKTEDKADQQASSSGSTKSYSQILTSIEYNNVYKIVLNRPQKKNAINTEMYLELREALSEADSNSNILFVCITGAGDFYCSGNDLSNFSKNMGEKSIQELAKEGRDFLEVFVNSFINFSKPIIGIINGPCVGISFTLLGLFDLVIASDRATFHAPFTKLGQSPEACSSHTFPRLMGTTKASEILIFNRKLTAQEAYERNLINEVIPHVNFQQEVWKKVEDFSKLPRQSFLTSRNLIRETDRNLFRQVNKRECDLLMERWSSEEFMQAIMEFFNRKSN